jgi:hypothetical protein
MYSTPQQLKLDIAILGYEEDKDKLKILVESFQMQLDNLKRNDVGVLFGFGQKYPDNIDEVKGRLVSNVAAKYYVLFDARESFMILPNYLESMLKILEGNENGAHAEEILLLNGINIKNG